MQPLTVSLLQTHTHWHEPKANRELFEPWSRCRSLHWCVPEIFIFFTMASAEVAGYGRSYGDLVMGARPGHTKGAGGSAVVWGRDGT